jgi:type II secretory pathway component HofQ
MRRLLWVCCLLLGTAVPARGDKGDSSLQTPVSFNAEDTPVVSVLNMLKAAGQLQLDVDPCVTGRLRMHLENVPLRTALEAVATSADLDVTFPQDSAKPIAVRCKPGSRAISSPPSAKGDPVRLEFRLSRLVPGRPREDLMNPRLATNREEYAEIAQESPDVQVFSLGENGETIVSQRGRRAAIGIFIPRNASETVPLRGRIEVVDSDAATRSSASFSRVFEVILPPPGQFVEATKFDLLGGTYELRVSQF